MYSLLLIVGARAQTAPAGAIGDVYDRHIVVLYDRSASIFTDRVSDSAPGEVRTIVPADPALLARINNYLLRILTEGLNDADITGGDYFSGSMALGLRSLSLPLWRPGDLLSFYTFGIDISSLSSIGDQAENGVAFIDLLSSDLLHGGARFAGPDSLAAREFLIERIHNDTKTYNRTLSRYVPSLMVRRLSASLHARRVVLVVVSDFKYGHTEANTADREIVRHAVPTYLAALDQLERGFGQSFNMNSLVQINAGGENGIALVVTEVVPSQMPAIVSTRKITAKLRDHTVDFSRAGFQVEGGSTAGFPFDLENTMLRLRAPGRGKHDLLVASATRLSGLNLQHFEVQFEKTAVDSLRGFGDAAFASFNARGLYRGRGGFDVAFPYVLSSDEQSISLASILRPSPGFKLPWWPIAAGIALILLAACGILFLRRSRFDISVVPDGVKECRRPEFNGWTITWVEGLVDKQVAIQLRHAKRRFSLHRLKASVELLGPDAAHEKLRGVDFRLIDSKGKESGIGSSVRFSGIKAGESGDFKLKIIFPGGFAIEEDIVPAFTLRLGIDTGRKSTSQEKRLVFCLEPDLGSFWIGIDPGTTGSCIAGGTQLDNIECVQSKNATIFPSFVYIPETLKDDGSPSIRNGVECGSVAEELASTHPDRCFTSAKRLIGYGVRRQIEVNGKPIELGGRDIVSVLIEYLLGEARIYFRDGNKPGSLRHDPKVNKAIIAVPNIFTPHKIRVFEECCRSAGIRHVDHIYEAEAIVLSYLKHHEEANRDRPVDSLQSIRNRGENILVFDFGGGSLNVCIVSLVPCAAGSEVMIWARMGYAIGGDVVDRIFAEHIWGQVGRALESIGNPFWSEEEARQHLAVLKRDNIDEALSEWRSLRISLKVFAKRMKEELSRAYLKDVDEARIREPWRPPLKHRQEFDINLRVTDLLARDDMRDIISKCRESIRDVYEVALKTGFNGKIDTLLIVGRSCQLFNVQKTVIEEIGHVLSSPGVRGAKENDAVDSGSAEVTVEADSRGTVEADDDVDVTETQSEDAVSLPFIAELSPKECVAEGAAYYGVQKANVVMKREVTYLNYGAKVFTGPSQKQVRFANVIPCGTPLDEGKAKGELESVSVRYNSGEIGFYQIAGAEPDKVVGDPSQIHKSAILGTCRVTGSTLDSISMEIDTNDVIRIVIEDSGSTIRYDANHDILDILADYDRKAIWPLV